ncbi:hypothetical protein V500_04933, partial [Pseudogymnoascus sp. VKM F-4518 (FW-2643)]
CRRDYLGCIAEYAGCEQVLPGRVDAGWTEEDTKSYTGPTLGVVTKLAENVRPKLESTYCICESGTAGPTGGTTKNRTPGYVALAVATPEGTFTREVDTGSADRAENMVNFAVEALKLLIDVIKGEWDVEASGRGGQAVNWNL